MDIGTVIREKRKALGLTQEQVAKRLGVTAPAVNKWERSGTYPDIMILPALARLLETDVNTLLGFREELTDQEIAVFCNEVAQIMERDGAEAGFAAAEKKIQEYPNCGKLIHMMASMAQGIMMMSGSYRKYVDCQKKIRSWHEMMLECGDEQVRNAAAYMLASEYITEKEYEKAQEMIDILPERGADKNIMRMRLYMEQDKTEEAAVILERGLVNNLNELLSVFLLSLIDIAVREGDMERAQKIARAGEETARLYDQWGYSPILPYLELSLKKKDAKGSITYIRQMFEMMTEPQHMSESPFFCHIYNQNEPGKNIDEALGVYSKRVLPGLVEELKTGEEYAFLRENEEFQKLLREYEKKDLQSEKQAEQYRTEA